MMLFAVNVSAAIWVCKVYDSSINGSHYTVEDKYRNRSVYYKSYMKPTLESYKNSSGKTEYVVIKANVWAELETQNNILPLYSENLGIKFDLNVEYQLNSGWYQSETFGAWTRMGTMTDPKRIFRSDEKIIETRNATFDYYALSSYSLVAELQYNCCSDSYPSGTVWDYAWVDVSLSTIVDDNTK